VLLTLSEINYDLLKALSLSARVSLDFQVFVTSQDLWYETVPFSY